jgi:hypothetical protein
MLFKEILSTLKRISCHRNHTHKQNLICYKQSCLWKPRKLKDIINQVLKLLRTQNQGPNKERKYRKSIFSLVKENRRIWTRNSAPDAVFASCEVSRPIKGLFISGARVDKITR